MGRQAERGGERLGRAERDRPPPVQRSVDQLEDQVVLPEAEPERHPEGCDADDYPRTQLVEVVDQAELVLVADWP